MLSEYLKRPAVQRECKTPRGLQAAEEESGYYFVTY